MAAKHHAIDHHSADCFSTKFKKTGIHLILTLDWNCQDKSASAQDDAFSLKSSQSASEKEGIIVKSGEKSNILV